MEAQHLFIQRQDRFLLLTSDVRSVCAFHCDEKVSILFGDLFTTAVTHSLAVYLFYAAKLQLFLLSQRHEFDSQLWKPLL